MAEITESFCPCCGRDWDGRPSFTWDEAAERIYGAGTAQRLTTYENRILGLLTARAGARAPIDELGVEDWGPEAEGKDGSVRVVVCRLNKKLEAAKTGYRIFSTGYGKFEYVLRKTDRETARPGVEATVLLPREPTGAMIDALNSYAQCAGYIEEGYRAMIAAHEGGK